MITQEKIANAIDKGYIKKCAEYGLNFNNQNDRLVILSLMQHSYNDIQKGNI